MKSQRILVSLAVAALGAWPTAAPAQTQEQPVVITPPAVNNGSNWSRAPFPSRRQHDDVKAPDGKAIDDLPPNSPATNIEPPPPEVQIAIFQPEPAPSPGFTGDPGLLPTGRPAVAVASTVEAATFAPTLRSATHASRDQIVADVQARLNASQNAMATVRGSVAQMSAAGREAFNTAADEVKDKAEDLRKSLQKARTASATEWEKVRTQLAADFDAYAAALARVDATAARR